MAVKRNLGSFGGMRGFACAYWEAAQTLANLHEGSTREFDFTAFPAAQLYRHSIELMLKGILLEFNQFHSSSPKVVLDRSHALGKHLDDVREVFSSENSQGSPVAGVNPAQLSHIKETIARWESIDQTGYSLRYGIEKNLKPMQTVDRKFVLELTALQKETEVLLECLSDAWDSLSAHVHWEQCAEAGVLQEDLNPEPFPTSPDE